MAAGWFLGTEHQACPLLRRSLRLEELLQGLLGQKAPVFIRENQRIQRVLQTAEVAFHQP